MSNDHNGTAFSPRGGGAAFAATCQISHPVQRRSRAPILAAALAALLLLTGAGCRGSEELELTVTPGEQAQAELESIRLPMGFIPNVQFAPFYVAVERGYFAEEGFELVFDYGFETQGVELVGAGELPFAVASGDQVILARAQGLPVVYITEWWQRFPVAIVSLAEAKILAPIDLAGHSVGVPELFGASYIGWQALLSTTGVHSSDVKLETIGYSQVPSLVEGRVDAAVVYANNEPVLLTQQGHEINLIEVADYADIVANGLVTSEKTITERPELVQAFVRAFLRGLSDTLAEPDAAFEICTHYVEGLSENAELGRAVLDASLVYWQADRLGYSEASTWEQSQQVMREAGLLGATLEVSHLFTNEFLSQP
jgi:NitT/TauT family transport system substrate-binding protein